MFRSLAIFVALTAAMAALAGCQSRNAEAKAVPHSQASASEAVATCTQMFVRERQCTDAFIPALVDARARLDMPAGIADAVRSDRDAVIAQAKQEWARDSTDDAIAEACPRLAAGIDAQLEQAARGCLADSDCVGFTTCIMPIVEHQLAKH